MIQIRTMGHRIMVAATRTMSNFVIIRDVIQQGRVERLGHNFIRPSQKEKEKGKICLRYKGQEEDEGGERMHQKIERFDQTNAKKFWYGNKRLY